MTIFTGSAVGPTALLRAISDHLELSAGYTLRGAQNDGTGRRHHLSVSNDVFVNLRSAVDEVPVITNWSGGKSWLGINLSLTTPDMTKPWFNQSGAPLSSGTTQSMFLAVEIGATQACNYWLIAETQADPTKPVVTLVIETSAGVCAVVGFGHLEKNAGAFTGGQYFFAENAVTNNASYKSILYGASKMYVRADVDSFTGKWLATSNGSTGTNAYTGKHAGTSAQLGGTRFLSDDSIVDFMTAPVDGAAPMLPAHVYVMRDDGGWSWLGDIPNLSITRRLPYPLSALRGSTLRLGQDTYMLFPGFAVRNTSPTRTAIAGNAHLLDSALQEYRGKVVPSVQAIDGGYITEPKTTSMRLWNVDQSREVAISAINQPDVYGLTVAPAGSFIIPPGASPIVTMTLETEGRPVVRDDIQFYIESLGALSPYVDASYFRAQVFTLSPNGRDSIRERLSFPSSVVEAHSGREQRASLVSQPRRVMECTVSTTTQAETQVAESLMYQGQARIFAAPRWPDARRLRGAVLPGATVLPVDTANGSFEAGSFAVVLVSTTEGYILEIDAVTDVGMTLVSATPTLFPAGSYIAPAMFCRIDADYSASVELADVVDYTLTFMEEV